MKSNCYNRSVRTVMVGLLAGVAVSGFLSDSAAQSSIVITNRPSTPSPHRPSIILIVADSLGYGDLSCYGQSKFQTPNLDRLAADGVRCTNYYAGAAAGSPARAALVLGKDWRHLSGQRNGNYFADPNAVTVAQVLKSSGYHTGLIGEWDSGDSPGNRPWEKGFDEFAGYLSRDESTNFYADYIWRYAPRSILNTNNQREDFVGKEMLYPNVGGKKGQYLPDLSTKAALNFMKNNQPDQFNRFRPFFLVLNYAIPANGNGPVPTDAPYSEEAWPQAQKNKAAMISRLDGYIGQIREQLEKLGLTNNAAIFFTSDTGPQKGSVDPAFFHSIIASNSLRVPMLVCWPEKIPSGQVSAYAWTASDFLPTAAAIALIKAPSGIDGQSVLPTLTGEAQINRHKFPRE